MHQFPILINDQVAVLRAEYNTGHIVDENFNLLINDNQTAYTIFESLETAQFYIKKQLEITNKFEFIIYGKDKAVINYTDRSTENHNP
jgi:hypothetical protein